MKYRVLNPRRKRKFSRKQLANQRKFARMVRSKKLKCKHVIVRSNPMYRIPNRRKKSRRYRRSRRTSNPVLAIGNPRRRHYRKTFARRSRRSNPKRGGRLIPGDGTSLAIDALGVGAGFLGATLGRNMVGGMIPMNTPTTEKVVNVALKAATGIAGYWLARQMKQHRFGRNFAVGAFTNAAFDVVAIVMGKPMSISEYVAPRTMGQGRRLRRLPNGQTIVEPITMTPATARRGLTAYPYPTTFKPLPTARLARAFGKSLPSAY